MKGQITATPLSFCNEKGLRIDRVFLCKVKDLPFISLDKTLKIGYTYQYSEKYGNRYSTDFQLDLQKQGSQRVTWFHNSDDLPIYSQNEIQAQPGDLIEIAVCIFNLNGLVRNVSWQAPEIKPFPQHERSALEYNKQALLLMKGLISYGGKTKRNDKKLINNTKVVCNTNRICEVEDAVVEWVAFSHNMRPRFQPEILDQNLLNYFNVLSFHFNDLDQHYSKLVLQAKKRGLYTFTGYNLKESNDKNN